MNVVDVVIILLLAMGFVVGMKKGFTRQLVDTVGVIVIIILAFLLKGYISPFFYRYFPIFQFSGKLEGITSLNFLLYEILSFLFLFAILYSVLKVLKSTTKLFEKILKMTIVLGIPSKILGGIVGLVENFILVFVLLYFCSLPMFDLVMVKESKLTPKILGSTPGLTQICKKTLDTFDEIENLVEDYGESNDPNTLNQKTLDLLLEKKIVNKEEVEHLIGIGKVKDLKV